MIHSLLAESRLFHRVCQTILHSKLQVGAIWIVTTSSVDDTWKNWQIYRSVQRMEATNRSPIFSHLSSSLNGLTLVRSCGAEEMLIAEFDTILNFHTSTYFTKLAISRWFGAALDWTTFGISYQDFYPYIFLYKSFQVSSHFVSTAFSFMYLVGQTYQSVNATENSN